MKLFTLEASLIRGTSVVLPDQVVRADVRIRGGRIVAIGPEMLPEPGETCISGEGRYLLPGFIDIHNHGAQGFDASLGCYRAETDSFELNENAFQAGLAEALAFYHRQGVTRVLPTSLAAPVADLLLSFGQIAAFATNPEQPLRHMIAGINLEGTFIKDPAYAGAQNSAYFCALDRGLFARLQAAADGRIRIVNLPPEHGYEGCAFTRYLCEQGVVVAGGHSAATSDQFDAAVDAGLRLGVHFLNGPSKSSSKPFAGGGAVESMLRRDEVSLELIVDGYHVAPAYVRDVIARKGPERIILITDSVFVNGRSDIRYFSLSGIPGQVSENGQYLQVRNKTDTLFGSVLCMDRGFSNVINWLTQPMTGVWTRQHEALSLDEALIQASRMASGQPAQLLGIYEQEGKSGAGTGSIGVGKWADAVLATVEAGPAGYAFLPEWTACRGVFTRCS